MNYLKLSFLSLFILLTCSSRAEEIFVRVNGNDNGKGTIESPFRTPHRALQEAREWRRLNDPRIQDGIMINLGNDTFHITRPLFIRPEDNGTKMGPTIFTQGTISGAVRVTGWQRFKGNIWVADSPMQGNRMIDFRQLWINGEKATLASLLPKGKMMQMLDFNKEKQTISVPSDAFFKVDKVDQLEMMIHQRWAIAILRVKDFVISGDSAHVTFHNPESQIEFTHPWPQPVINEEGKTSSFSLHNSMAFLDQPGEWFREYPSGKIYYFAEPDQDMNALDVVIPGCESLVQIEGSLERPVSNVGFLDVNFEYTAWNEPSYRGHVTLQAGFAITDAYKLEKAGLPHKASLENQAWIERPKAAVSVRGADNIRFQKCDFRHLEATALDFEWAVNNCAVNKCHFKEIGGTGLMMGTFPCRGFETHIPFIPQNSGEMVSAITVADNSFSDIASEDWGCAGISAGYVSDVTIEHNVLSKLNYSGICVGWGWTGKDSGMKNNIIKANYIYDFARQLYDAGGIYTLSSQPGSKIIENRIEELYDAPYATNSRGFYIYLDEATDNYLIDNNWCPSEKFGDNQPGSGVVWKKNGPKVEDTIKKAAGPR